MPALNAIEYLKTSLRMQHGRVAKDLKALPEETHRQSLAGCAKSPLWMVAECAWVNGWITDVLQGGPADRLTDEEEAALFGSVDTAEQALAMLDESVTKLLAAYDALDEGTLERTSPTSRSVDPCRSSRQRPCRSAT